MTRIALLAALFVSSLGCGGGDPCAGSKCPNDARPTQAQYQECVNRHIANQNNACYQKNTEAESCAYNNTLCTSAGTTDTGATFTAQSNNCKAANDAALCCASSFFCK